MKIFKIFSLLMATIFIIYIVNIMILGSYYQLNKQPKIYATTAYGASIGGGIVNIYLSGEIMDAAYYVSLNNYLINNVKNSDTVYLHLAGMGGDAGGYVYLVNILKATKANIIPIIDGNIASAHAFLALSFDHSPIVHLDQGWVLFHNVSTTNEEHNMCITVTGTDRGYNKQLKCLEDSRSISAIYNDYIYKIVDPVLSSDERGHIRQGRDIIMSLQSFEKRITK